MASIVLLRVDFDESTFRILYSNSHTLDSFCDRFGKSLISSSCSVSNLTSSRFSSFRLWDFWLLSLYWLGSRFEGPKDTTILCLSRYSSLSALWSLSVWAFAMPSLAVSLVTSTCWTSPPSVDIILKYVCAVTFCEISIWLTLTLFLFYSSYRAALLFKACLAACRWPILIPATTPAARPLPIPAPKLRLCAMPD